MDYNVTVIAGVAAAKPERRWFEEGAEMFRVLVTVRSEQPQKRVDVIPVTFWRDDMSTQVWGDLLGMEAGTRIYVTATVQRRFWTHDNVRKSQIELIGLAATIGRS